MNIPVFHDDQHGTAIITAAGLINACHLTGRALGDIRVVVNGAGAAAIACTELIKAMGVRGDHVIMCDRKGVIHKGRDDLDQWKSAHAVDTDRRTLKDALVGRRRVPRPVGGGRAQARHGHGHGAQPDHLRDGQSRPRNHPARSQGRAARRDRRHRPLGLSQPGQQRPRLPVHLPRRARRARDGRSTTR